MPDIQKRYDAFKEKDEIVFLMISNENADKINSFMTRKQFHFPVYSNPSKTPAIFAVNSIPTTFVISKKGVIVIQETGAANWGGSKMQAIIKGLLQE